MSLSHVSCAVVSARRVVSGSTGCDVGSALFLAGELPDGRKKSTSDGQVEDDRARIPNLNPILISGRHLPFRSTKFGTYRAPYCILRYVDYRCLIRYSIFNDKFPGMHHALFLAVAVQQHSCFSSNLILLL